MPRLHKTLADYAVLAISPALIMVLIGSLVFFLVLVFYQGEFDGRVRWIFAWYIFATVLLSRLAIDEGRERAVFFAIPLALAMLLALGRFVQMGLIAHLALMGLIWWCADKLVWDCTVLDQRPDASGSGLLQTVGWRHRRPLAPREAIHRSPLAPREAPHRSPVAPREAPHRSPLAPREATHRSPLAPREETPPPAHPTTSAPQPRGDQDLEATTSREPPTPAALWTRFLEHRRRAHAPGVWVIYLSLAALPLFGLGQRFIPPANLTARRAAFWYMCYFAAAALGLLLTSSFLNLRRYLRKRQLEMPAQMAGVWLGTGAAMIVVVLLLCMALPRPYPEYSITHTEWRIGALEKLQTSRWGMGREGADDPQQRSSTARGDQSAQPEGSGATSAHSQRPAHPPAAGGDQASSADQAKSSKTPSTGADGSGDDTGSRPAPGVKSSPGSAPAPGVKPSPDSKSASGAKPPPGSESASGAKPPPGSESAAGAEPSAKPGESATSASGESGGSETAGQKPPRQSSPEPSESSRAAAKSPGHEQSAAEPRGEERASAEGGRQQHEPPPSAAEERPADGAPSSRQLPQPAEMLNRAVGSLPYVLRTLYYLAFLLLVAYLVWRYHAQIKSALQNFLQALRDFWDGLFGRRTRGRGESAEPAIAPAPPRPFASFADPFSSGQLGRFSPRELVVYSFHALEAWGREHGCPRGEDQTPHEYAAQLAAAAGEVSREARTLADLYCAAAYSQQPLPPASIRRLERLWQFLRASQRSVSA